MNRQGFLIKLTAYRSMIVHLTLLYLILSSPDNRNSEGENKPIMQREFLTEIRFILLRKTSAIKTERLQLAKLSIRFILTAKPINSISPMGSESGNSL
jgi:hypothetical protein